MSIVVDAIHLPTGLAIGLVLMAASAPIMTAPTFALILGLEASFAIAVVVLNHILLPFTLPAMSLWLLNLEMQISLGEFMGRLLLMIGGGFAVAIILKRFALTPVCLHRHALHIDGLVVVLSLIHI